jgi:hypothetical protein
VSVDAVALCPGVSLPTEAGSEPLDGDWVSIAGHAARPLRDGVLVNLGFSFAAPDGELYRVAQDWAGKLSDRIWIFPDTFVPEGDTCDAVQAATRGVGRWIRGTSSEAVSLLEELGLSAEDAAACRRDVSSGDPARVQAALQRLEASIGERDPAQVEKLIEAFLKR